MAFAGRSKLFNAKIISLILLAAWTYAFWPTLQQMAIRYIRSGFDYQGLLIIPAFFLLVMSKSKALKRSNSHYSPLGLFLLLLCAAAWLFASVLELKIPAQIAVITMLIAIVLMNFGRKTTNILCLPLLCLFLLLPIGEATYHAVQQAFTWLLTQSLTLCSQAVYWDHEQITVNNNIYDIGAYLSCMHNVLLLVLCGAVYATFRSKQLLTALCIQLSFIVMPFCMLFICLFSYIMLNTFFTNLQFINNHMLGCGWTLTCLGILHALILGYLMREHKNIIHRNDNIDWRDMQIHANSVLQPLLLGACVLLLVPFIATHIVSNDTYNNAILVTIPGQITNWNKQVVANNTQGIQAKFRKSNDTVNVSIAHEATPLAASWQELKQSSKTIKLDQQKISVHETVLQNAKNKYKILWQVNYINGHYTNNDTVAKALRHVYNLAANGAKSGIISISTDAGTELNSARDRLKNFMQDFTTSTQALG